MEGEFPAPRQDSVDKEGTCQISGSRATLFDIPFRGDSDQIILSKRKIKGCVMGQNCPDRKTALSRARPSSYNKGCVQTLVHGHHVSSHGTGPASRHGLQDHVRTADRCCPSLPCAPTRVRRSGSGSCAGRAGMLFHTTARGHDVRG